MSDTHRDRSDYYPGARGRDADLSDMETLTLMQEVRSLARDMTIAIINSHREERNKRLAKEKYDRLHTAMTIVYNRQFDIIIEKNDEITHLKEALDIRNDEYDALRDRLDRELPMWEADQLAIRLLKKRIARMKIRNWMRQIRPLNPPPLVPPIAPPQPTNQVWLLL